MDFAHLRAGESPIVGDDDFNKEDGAPKMLILMVKDQRTGTFEEPAMDAKGPTTYAVKWFEVSCGVVGTVVCSRQRRFSAWLGSRSCC